MEATRQYPDDAESWYMVGIVRDLFYDDLPSVTVAQVADAFDRAITLDSAFAPAYRPAFRYALDEGRVEAGREYARKYLTLSPPEQASGIPLLLYRLLAPAPDEAELDGLLNDLHPETLFRTWTSLWLLTDSTELAIRVARKSAERDHDPRYWTTAPQIVNRNLAASLAYRGHLRESVEVAGGDYATWFQALVPEAAMLGFVPEAVADSSFADWLEQEEFDPDVLAHEVWWWASRSDTSAIKRYLERGGLEPIGRAALTLARGDTAQAILQLEQVKTSRIHTNLTVLAHARLLEAKGRPAEALEGCNRDSSTTGPSHRVSCGSWRGLASPNNWGSRNRRSAITGSSPECGPGRTQNCSRSSGRRRPPRGGWWSDADSGRHPYRY
jgi:hypothetical protein